MVVTERGRELFVLIAMIRNDIHPFYKQAEYTDWLIERKNTALPTQKQRVSTCDHEN